MLKYIFDDERRKYKQQEYERLKKKHFLKIYATAHTHVLTEDIVKAIFARTNIVLYNPQVIQTAIFKPSIKASIIETGTPIPGTLIPPTSIRLVQCIIQDTSHRPSHDVSLASTHFLTIYASEIPTSDSDPHLQYLTINKQVKLLTESLKALQTTLVEFLFSEYHEHIFISYLFSTFPYLFLCLYHHSFVMLMPYTIIQSYALLSLSVFLIKPYSFIIFL